MKLENITWEEVGPKTAWTSLPDAIGSMNVGTDSPEIYPVVRHSDNIYLGDETVSTHADALLLAREMWTQLRNFHLLGEDSPELAEVTELGTLIEAISTLPDIEDGTTTGELLIATALLRLASLIEVSK